MHIDEKIKEIEKMNIKTGVHILQNKGVMDPNKVYVEFNNKYYDTHKTKEENHYKIEKSNAFIEYAHQYNTKMNINENLYRLYTN